MSYTYDVRHMLYTSELKKSCCARTELGLLMCFSAVNGTIKCEDKELVKRVSFLCRKVLHIKPQVFCRRNVRRGGVNDECCFVRIPETGDLLSAFCKPSFFKTAEECCKKALLRCAFLAGGTISDPEKASSYIELYFPDEAWEQAVCGVLSDFGIRHGAVLRRGKRVVYIKNFEGICDFLTLTGAQKAMLDFQVGKTKREVTNNVNRTMNCDMANIARASAVAERELRTIEMLAASGRLELLPPALYELASLRLNNRYASLAELGEMLNPPLSKSGVSHRMKKIAEYAGNF